MNIIKSNSAAFSYTQQQWLDIEIKPIDIPRVAIAYEQDCITDPTLYISEIF